MAELVGTTDTTVDSVPIEMLDYAYVGSCTDVKLVQKILAVLKSGKEGLYPDLIKFTEDKYLELLPPKERKKYQAMNHQTTNAEKYEAEQEIKQWVDSTNKSDQFVMLKPVKKDIPVRGTAKKPVETKAPEVVNADITARPSTSQTDAKRYPFLANSQVMKLLNLRREHQVLSHSELQRQHIANQEKLKGNECFKMNENDKAVLHYSKSLAFDDSKAAIWANRAMTYIRLELFNYAEEDCSVALSLDATYVKALFRRGLVRFKMGKYAESISDFGKAMLLEPDNLELAKLWKSALDKYAEYPDMPVQTDGSSSAMLVTLLSSERDSLFPSDFSSKWECVHSGSLQTVSAAASVAASSGLVGIPVYPDHSSSDAVVVVDEAAVQLAQKDTMSARYKDLGNKLIRSPHEAIKWYDLSLRCNSEYVPSLNNRAQANLSTKDYAQVVSDSSVVLKLEPLNLKALYRRAVALHGLNRLDAALEDIVSLLSMDRSNLLAVKLYAQILLDRARALGNSPANGEGVVRECTALLDFVRSAAVSAVAESDVDLTVASVSALLLRAEAYAHSDLRVPLALSDVEYALKLQPSNNEAALTLREKLRVRVGQINAASDAAGGLPTPPPAVAKAPVAPTAASAVVPPPAPPVVAPSASASAPSKSPSPPPPPAASGMSTPPRPPAATTAKAAGSKTSATSAAASVSSAAALKAVNSPLPEASTPLHPPRTMNEFERVWRSMKGQPAMFAGYLEIFKSNSFEKVIKESTSAECLSSIFQAWRDHFPSIESRLSSMKNFAKVPGFKFMLSVLPEEDLSCIRAALEDAESRCSDRDKVKAVRTLYNM